MYQQKIVIVGAGIIGLSTAYALLRQGMKHVTVLEQATVDHQRATSHGLSRLLRFEYGTDLFYSELVQLSLQRWRALERDTQQTLYTPTGLLVLGHEGDNFTQPSYHILRELGLPVERLSHQSCKQRFPQFHLSDYELFTYNPEAGILHASACLHALKALILDLGGNIYETQRVTRITHANQLLPIRLHLDGGGELSAERVVLATGPWVHYLLSELHLPVRLTRQYLLYFANLPISSFAVSTFPSFIANDLYGFPIHDTRMGEYGPLWFKAASHTFGVPVDPNDTPVLEEHAIAQIVKKLCDLLPPLKDATLIHVDSCMYDVTPDEDFILDCMPDDPRIVFATGLTGHGFKFGPLLGELLSCLIRETPPQISMERFQLSRFTHQWKAQQTFVA